MSQPRAHAPLPLHEATEPYTSSQQTASTHSWLCHSRFLLQCSALGKGLLIKKSGLLCESTLGDKGSWSYSGPSSSKAVMWRTWGLRFAFPDRQYLLVWVQKAGCFFFFIFFFCQWSDIYKKFILCSFHRHLKEHCVYSYVTEWQLLSRKWSHASGIFASGKINHLAKYDFN